MVPVMSSSSKQARLLFGFEPIDWVFLAGSIALAAVVPVTLSRAASTRTSTLENRRIMHFETPAVRK